MYEKLLNIIYTYTFNYKLPDRNFINEVVNTVIEYYELNSFISNIEYNYNYIASYSFISKVLKFDIDNIIKSIDDRLKRSTSIYNLNELKLLERYELTCYETIYTILHELEHVKQVKLVKTTDKNNLEVALIKDSIYMLSINQGLYKKNHDIFPIERMAVIRSNSSIIEMLKLDSDTANSLSSIYIKRCNSYKKDYYSNDNFPLLEYVTSTNSELYYENILINKKNTKKILRKSKKNLSLNDRIILGLPITTNEYDGIEDK